MALKKIIGRGPRELCHSVPWGVKGSHSVPPGSIFFFFKKGSVAVGDRENRVAPEERYVSLPRFIA